MNQARQQLFDALMRAHAELIDQLDFTNRQLGLYAKPSDSATQRIITENKRLLATCRRYSVSIQTKIVR